MPRLEGVDFVKGVAITAIIMFHTFEAIYGYPGHDLFGFLQWGIVRFYLGYFSFTGSPSIGLLHLTCLGYQGVHVFIVLSGILQMRAYRDREFNNREFYTKRFLRLYPIYWLVILLVIILNLIVHGNIGATPTQIILLIFGWAGVGLPFNSALWFMGLILQLYLVFPLLLAIFRNYGEQKFLLGTWIVSVFSLFFFPPPYVGLFFMGWLFEFCVGMVLANYYSRVESIIHGIKPMALLLLAYILGLVLSNFRIGWPLGRPLYGIALTLLIWSIYSTIKEVDIFKLPRRFFVFMGLISFPLWLINQPFMQEYYLLIGSPDLTFRSQIGGDLANFGILPISKFLLIELSYSALIIILSIILAKLDDRISRVISARANKLKSHASKII